MVYSVISALGRQKWKNCHKFDASQDYIVRTCLKRSKTIKHVGVRCVERLAMQMWGPEFRFLATVWELDTCVISALGSGDRSRWSFLSAKPVSREFCIQWETLSQKYREWYAQIYSWGWGVTGKFQKLWLVCTMEEEWGSEDISVLLRYHVLHCICSSFQPNLVLCLNYVLCLSVPFQGLLSFMTVFLAVVYQSALIHSCKRNVFACF